MTTTTETTAYVVCYATDFKGPHSTNIALAVDESDVYAHYEAKGCVFLDVRAAKGWELEEMRCPRVTCEHVTEPATVVVTVHEDEYEEGDPMRLSLRKVAEYRREFRSDRMAKFRAREIAESVRCFGTQTVGGYELAATHFFVSVQDADGNWVADYSERVMQAMREKRAGDVDIFDCLGVSGFERIA